MANLIMDLIKRLSYPGGHEGIEETGGRRESGRHGTYLGCSLCFSSRHFHRYKNETQYQTHTGSAGHWCRNFHLCSVSISVCKTNWSGEPTVGVDIYLLPAHPLFPRSALGHAFPATETLQTHFMCFQKKFYRHSSNYKRGLQRWEWTPGPGGGAFYSYHFLTPVNGNIVQFGGTYEPTQHHARFVFCGISVLHIR